LASDYARKISSEEEREGHLLILKDRLSFFPSVGTTFSLVTPRAQKSETIHRVSVESYECECRGPSQPHEHYYLVPGGKLAKGKIARITRASKDPRKYTLSIS
jgi:hypothetical protein